MANYLMLNSVDVPTHKSSGWVPVSWGPRERAQSSRFLHGRRARFHKGDFESTIIDGETAEAFKGLIDGLGLHWGFDDGFHSDHGVMPTSLGTSSLVASVPPKFGANSLRVPSATTIQWQFVLDGVHRRCSVILWYYLSAAWHQHIITFTDDARVTHWRDGVTTGTPYGVTVASVVNADRTVSWTLTLTGVNPTTGANAQADFDDLVFVPYHIPSTWVAALYARTRAFSALPYLELSGEVLGTTTTDTAEVSGMVSSVDAQQSSIAGVWGVNNQAVSFSLEQR